MRILYIEDNPQDVDLTGRALAGANGEFVMETVPTLREALQRVKNEPFDLLLCDMGLPDGSALDLIKNMSGFESQPAIVVITGWGDEETAVAVLKAGADDYLVKRKNYLDLLPSVLTTAHNRHLEESHRHAEPLRVLYCEHNLVDIDLTTRHMARVASYIHLDIATSSMEFFAKLFPGAKPSPYQVVIIDYRMPGKNGLEILKELKQVRNSDIPVIIITGHGDEEMAAQVLKLGAADYIVKHNGYLFTLPSILENAYSRAQLERERKALQESELRYRSLFDHANDAIMILDGEHFIDCNAKTEQTFGMPRSAILGATPAELSPEVQPDGEKSQKSAMLRINATLEKGENLFEWQYQKGDGTSFDAEVSLSRFNLSGHILIQAIVRDITGRKLAERALHESEVRYRGLFEDSPISLWEEDFSLVKQSIENLRKQGVTDFRAYFGGHPEMVAKYAHQIRTVDVNQATLKLFAARNKAEIIKNLDKIVDATNENMLDELVNIAEGKTDFEWQGINHTLAGESRVVSLRWSVAPGYEDSLSKVILSIIDVTERKQAEEALRQSEDRYRGIFENSPISLLEEDYSSVKQYIEDLRKKGVKSFRDYFKSHPEAVIECTHLIKTLEVNQATLKMFAARSKTEIVKNSDAILGETSENMLEQLVNIAEGKTNFEWQGVNYTLTGEPRVVSLRWSAAPGCEDTLSKILLSMIDVTERKQAEEALQKSERRYRSLFEDSPISLWEEDFSEVKQFVERLRRRGVKDFRAYFASHLKTAARCMKMIRVVDVNKATLKLFRAKYKDEIVGNWGALIGISDARMVDELAGLAEGRTDFEWQEINHTLAGEERVVNLRWSIAPGYEDSLSKVVLSLVDVTERIRAEEKLQASEQKLRRVIDESVDGVVLTDEKGYIQEWNAGQERITGQKWEDVIGRPIWDVQFEVALPEKKTPEILEAFRSMTKQLLETGQAPWIGKLMESELLRATDGAHVFVQSVIFPIKTEKGFMVCGISRDVTEQKGVIERLELQSTALGAAANGIFITNEEGAITWVNPAFSKLTGYSFAEMVGDNTIIQTELRNVALYDALLKATRAGKIWGGELVIQRKGGGTITTELTVTPVLGEKNKITGYIGIMNDITESLERKQELEASAHVSEALRVAQTREEMYPIILDQLMSLLRTDAADIVLRDLATDELKIVAAAGEVETIVGVYFKPGEGVVRKVIASGKPYITVIEQEPNIVFSELFKKSKFGVWYPLLAQNEVLGTIFLGRSTPLEDTELRLIESVANMAANAFQRTHLFEQMQERLQQMEVQRDIDQAILTSFDLRMTLNVLLRHLITQLNVAAADILLLDANTNDLEIAAGQGYSNPPRARLRVKVGEGAAGKVILEGKPLFVSNVHDAPELFKFSPADFDELASYYAVPLVAKGQPKGVLEVMTRAPLKPTPEWKQFLETLARQAAIAIENAQMFDTLQRSNTDLLIAYDATIEGWVRALDMRDKETEGHTLRVADMMVDLARELRISELDLIHVRRGALLHDIGKVGVPDSILLKPGPLTDEEWKIMRRHPQYAYDMLYPITYLRPAIEIPYCHHEKWDGSGYPRGLKGEEIPLTARIFAVVDVWDALLSERPYRSAWSKKTTLDYIRSQSGKHFDPKVVEAFVHWVERKPKPA